MYRTLFLSILVCAHLAFANTLEVIRKIPHTGYSEGLDYHEGYLWHALPREIVKIDPSDGTVLLRFQPASQYSESVMWFLGYLWNVSYSDNHIYAATLEGRTLKFGKVGTVPEVHAWGLTHDGKSIIVTGNYSNKLYFLNPKTLQIEKTLTTPVKDLEDLAWDGVGIWSSSFSTYRGQIFRIDPKSGDVRQFFSIPNPEECPIVDGIAYDGKNLWITGKNCASIYYVKKPPERAITSKPR